MSINPVTLEGVYYVESVEVPMGRIAIRPSFSQKQVTWDDTQNGMVVHLDEKSPHLQELETRQTTTLLDRIHLVYRKHQITLRYLTLELYNHQLQSHIVGNPSFSSTEEVQQFFLNTDFHLD